MRNQRKLAYSGGMTQGSRKRIAKAITIMCQGIKPGWKTNPCTQRMQYHKFSFITLTVSTSRNITARIAYDKLLNHFLDWMTRTIAKDMPSAKTYVWKAELQKRGQIHYHITTPALIHHRVIRDKWNALQREAGLLDEYAKEHGHFNPNSTDIHDTRSVRKMDRYLIKELCKNVDANKLKAIQDADQMIQEGKAPEQMRHELEAQLEADGLKTMGKVWGCSEDLAGVGYFTIGEQVKHLNVIDEWVREGLAWRKDEDFFSIIYCEGVDPPDLLDLDERKRMEDYLGKMLKRSEQVKLLEIPEECLQVDQVDILQTYTVAQMKLFLN